MTKVLQVLSLQHRQITSEQAKLFINNLLSAKNNLACLEPVWSGFEKVRTNLDGGNKKVSRNAFGNRESRRTPPSQAGDCSLPGFRI